MVKGHSDIHFTLDTVKFIIIPYDILSKQLPFFSKVLTVICDEAHCLAKFANGNMSSQQLLQFIANRERLLLVTSNPYLDQPEKLLLLLQLLRPDLFGEWEEFLSRYSYAQTDSQSGLKTYSGVRNVLELRYILKKTVMIRRTKQEAIAQLPSEHREVISLATLPSVVKKIKTRLVE